MQITLTKEQVREAFGELRYMGADYCYKYDKETRKKTEEVEYAPYVQRGNFPVLVDRISCKGIRVVTGKGNV